MEALQDLPALTTVSDVFEQSLLTRGKIGGKGLRPWRTENSSNYKNKANLEAFPALLGRQSKTAVATTGARARAAPDPGVDPAIELEASLSPKEHPRDRREEEINGEIKAFSPEKSHPEEVHPSLFDDDFRAALGLASKGGAAANAVPYIRVAADPAAEHMHAARAGPMYQGHDYKSTNINIDSYSTHLIASANCNGPNLLNTSHADASFMEHSVPPPCMHACDNLATGATLSVKTRRTRRAGQHHRRRRENKTSTLAPAPAPASALAPGPVTAFKSQNYVEAGSLEHSFSFNDNFQAVYSQVIGVTRAGATGTGSAAPPSLRIPRNIPAQEYGRPGKYQMFGTPPAANSAMSVNQYPFLVALSPQQMNDLDEFQNMMRQSGPKISLQVIYILAAVNGLVPMPFFKHAPPKADGSVMFDIALPTFLVDFPPTPVIGDPYSSNYLSTVLVELQSAILRCSKERYYPCWDQDRHNLAHQLIDCLNYVEYGTFKSVHVHAPTQLPCAEMFKKCLDQAFDYFDKEIYGSGEQVYPHLKSHARNVAEHVKLQRSRDYY